MNGAELAERRTATGLTQDALSRLAGVSQPNIAAYETGRRPLTSAMGARLREHLRRRPSEVLELHHDAILSLLTRYGVSNVRVIGSVACGTDTVWSDLDLLVSPRPDMGLFAFVAMAEELTEITGLRVDVLSDRGLLPADQHLVDQARPL